MISIFGQIETQNNIAIVCNPWNSIMSFFSRWICGDHIKNNIASEYTFSTRELGFCEALFWFTRKQVNIINSYSINFTLSQLPVTLTYSSVSFHELHNHLSNRRNVSYAEFSQFLHDFHNEYATVGFIAKDADQKGIKLDSFIPINNSFKLKSFCIHQFWNEKYHFFLHI